MKLKIFCDFDGTVTQNDVWMNSLGQFIGDRGKWDEICRDFKELKITARQCNQSELDLLENFSFEKLDEYLEKEQLDPYFKPFLEYCKSENWQVTLVSEGLDYYIKKILQREGLEDITLYSNCLRTEETDGKVKLKCEFPNTDENCFWCGTCKRNVLVNGTNDLDGEISVLIGDGVSDYCASHFADVVFAKKSLASYCWKNNITYFEYKTFFDITKKLKKLKENRKLKQRQEASFRRRDLFLGG